MILLKTCSNDKITVTQVYDLLSPARTERQHSLHKNSQLSGKESDAQSTDNQKCDEMGGERWPNVARLRTLIPNAGILSYANILPFLGVPYQPLLQVGLNTTVARSYTVSNRCRRFILLANTGILSGWPKQTGESAFQTVNIGKVQGVLITSSCPELIVQIIVMMRLNQNSTVPFAVNDIHPRIKAAYFGCVTSCWLDGDKWAVHRYVCGSPVQPFCTTPN